MSTASRCASSTVPGKQHLTGFAREAGAHALRFLAGYFELPLPARQDRPRGDPRLRLRRHGEPGLRHLPGERPAHQSGRGVAAGAAAGRDVVAHETAHMWFGDLVTMRWWNGIWLNEAFATFMELIATDDFRPEWQRVDRLRDRQGRGPRHRRPAQHPAGGVPGRPARRRPRPCSTCSPTRRAPRSCACSSSTWAPETFRKGISHYLTVHAYANTETTDLWDALEAVSGEPVRAIMDTWILQGGYPLISVEPGEDQASIRLTQERFLYDGGGAGRRDGGERWAVPVNLRASVGGVVQRQRLLVDGASATINFDGPVDWVVVNDGGWGFYRVRYDPALLDRLSDRRPAGRVRSARAHGPGRRQLGRRGGGPDGLWPHWVQIVRSMSLGQEDDPDVWAAVGGALALLDLIAADGRDRSALQRFVAGYRRSGLGPAGLGPRPSDTERLEHHPWASGLRPGPARARTPGYGGRHASGSSAISRTAIRAGPRPAHPGGQCGGSLRRCRRLGPHPGAVPGRRPRPRTRCATCWPCLPTSDPALLARTLDLALSDEVRTQDAPFLVAGVMSNRAGARPGLAVGGGSLGATRRSACRPAWSPASSKGSRPSSTGTWRAACTPSRPATTCRSPALGSTSCWSAWTSMWPWPGASPDPSTPPWGLVTPAAEALAAPGQATRRQRGRS